MANELLFLFIVFLISLVIFLIIRQLVLWYWKINKIVSNQEEQKVLLERIVKQLELINQPQIGSNTHPESMNSEANKDTAENSGNSNSANIFEVGDAVYYFNKPLVISRVNGDGTYGCNLPDGKKYDDSIEGRQLRKR